MAETVESDFEVGSPREKDSLLPLSTAATTSVAGSNNTFFHRHRHLFLAALSIFFLLSSQAAATLLSRFYFAGGGNCMWLSTLVQVGGVPLLLPLFFLPSFTVSKAVARKGSMTTTIVVYVGIGLLIAGDDMLHSYGIAYLPVSTYSLLCATQLAFNSLTSFFLNAQKLTPPILNSLVLLTFSSILLAVRSNSERPSGVSAAQQATGFFCTLAASALYALILSLTQFSFNNYFKKETFSIVLEMHVSTDLAAMFAGLVGLFVSGSWRSISDEYRNFEAGKIAYIMTVAGIAILWQICSVSVMGLIFTVSSLFSTVISTMALPIVPVLAVFVFSDKMDAVKLMALFLSLWGFASYLYDQYVEAGGKQQSFSYVFPKRKRTKTVDSVVGGWKRLIAEDGGAVSVH